MPLAKPSENARALVPAAVESSSPRKRIRLAKALALVGAVKRASRPRQASQGLMHG